MAASSSSSSSSSEKIHRPPYPFGVYGLSSTKASLTPRPSNPSIPEFPERLLLTYKPDEPKPIPSNTEVASPPLLADTKDLLGLNTINPDASLIEESNALALAIVPSSAASTDSAVMQEREFDPTGWELALVIAHSSISSSTVKSQLFFEMPRHEAIKALEIYKRAGLQVENHSDFYEACRGFELVRNFQFPNLREPPQSSCNHEIREAPTSCLYSQGATG